MEQLDIFGGAEPADTPMPPQDTGADQLSLFRPDFRAMRAPKPRRAAQPAPLAPALHGDALI
jgi:hypothetical protein